ncbi:MAG: tripartite tricarboxylate transporter substrate binding protein [Cytophagales bacterium]|nr:tripartite tricarboxylate transporter substrate binding protein [Cytophagales bacterium]
MHKLLAIFLIGAFAVSAQAQTAFPTKTIKIIVPNAAGGAADITSRQVGQKLSEAFGSPVVIENKPSAGGIVAADMVVKAAPDGHTLLLISSGTAVSAALFQSLPFDTLKDFTPVSKLATFDLVIAASDRGRFHTLGEVIAYAKANPGKLNIGTPQIGTTQNFAAELFKSMAGIEAQLVPFNGTPPVISALRGGEIDIMVEILGPLVAQFNSKALRPLAIMGDKRTPQFEGVPTVRESGGSLASFNVSSWNGLAAPAKTPKEVVAKLSSEIQKALKNPEVIKNLEVLYLYPQGSTPEALAETLGADIKRWSDVMSRAKIAKQ